VNAPAIRAAAALVLVAALIAAAACHRAEPVEVTFTIEGMHCEGCSAAITQALKQAEGVEAASADHVAGTAAATCRSSDVDPQQLAREIEGLGYTVTSVTVTPAGS
jgi:copper chaperone CopZ